MGINNTQYNHLTDLIDDNGWPVEECNGTNKRTLNALSRKGLAIKVEYANGIWWQATDKADDAIKDYKKKYLSDG
jgi:glycine betaine/choline ABC-type transport system substrate-binding protein